MRVGGAGLPALHPHLSLPTPSQFFAADGLPLRCRLSQALVSKQLHLACRGTTCGIQGQGHIVARRGVGRLYEIVESTELRALVRKLVKLFIKRRCSRDGSEGMVGDGEAEKCDECDELHDGNDVNVDDFFSVVQILFYEPHN